MVAIQVNSTEPYTAWLMTTELPDPSNPGNPSILDVWEMMQTVAAADYRCTLVSYADATAAADGTITKTPAFMLTISKAGFPDQQAPVGEWVVFDGTYTTVLDDATFRAGYAAQAGQTLPPPPPPLPPPAPAPPPADTTPPADTPSPGSVTAAGS